MISQWYSLCMVSLVHGMVGRIVVFVVSVFIEEKNVFGQYVFSEEKEKYLQTLLECLCLFGLV